MKTTIQPLPWTPGLHAEDSPERERFLESHIDLVRYVALRISSRLPASVELDDLIHDGILGLMDAVGKYDPARGVRFRTYAEARVRGAILDGLRQDDWRPRSVRLAQRNLDEAVGRLAAVHGRPATEEEIAEALGIEVAELRSLLSDVHVGSMLSLEDLPPGTETEDPAGGEPHLPLERKDLIRVLALEIERLPPRERRVLALYYHEGLNMKEVGAVLGVTESRVCQLHSQAASRLRVALRDHLHAAPVAGGRS